MLERVIEAPNATANVRDQALDLLRAHYDATQKSREVIRVLEKVIALAPASAGLLHEEAGSRLADLDDLPAAMDHYAALLAMTPESSATEERLRGLADRGGLHDRYADGVANAARQSQDPTRRVELLAEAARTRLDRANDVEGAIKLLVEASDVSGAAEHEQLLVARKLAGLYAQTNRPKERLDVLERQAHLEANERRAQLDPLRGGQAGRVSRRGGARPDAVGASQRRRPERHVGPRRAHQHPRDTAALG